MHRTRTFLAWTLAVCALTSLAQCSGKKTESAKTSFEIAPGQPIVITADTLANGQTITAPWFKFLVKVTNGGDQQITIVGLSAKIYTPGSAESVDWAADPSGITGPSSDSLTCMYTSFGTIQPGATANLGGPSSTSGCNIDKLWFYVSGLTKPKGSAYRYRVVMKVLGWFGTEAEPTDRFDGRITFYTQ